MRKEDLVGKGLECAEREYHYRGTEEVSSLREVLKREQDSGDYQKYMH